MHMGVVVLCVVCQLDCLTAFLISSNIHEHKGQVRSMLSIAFSYFWFNGGNNCRHVNLHWKIPQEKVAVTREK